MEKTFSLGILIEGELGLIEKDVTHSQGASQEAFVRLAERGRLFQSGYMLDNLNDWAAASSRKLRKPYELSPPLRGRQTLQEMLSQEGLLLTA